MRSFRTPYSLTARVICAHGILSNPTLTDARKIQCSRDPFEPRAHKPSSRCVMRYLLRGSQPDTNLCFEVRAEQTNPFRDLCSSKRQHPLSRLLAPQLVNDLAIIHARVALTSDSHAFAFHETLRSHVPMHPFDASTGLLRRRRARLRSRQIHSAHTVVAASVVFASSLRSMKRRRRLRALIFNVLSSRQLGFFVSEAAALPELLSLPSRAPHLKNRPQFSPRTILAAQTALCFRFGSALAGSQTLDDEARCASESVSFLAHRQTPHVLCVDTTA